MWLPSEIKPRFGNEILMTFNDFVKDNKVFTMVLILVDIEQQQQYFVITFLITNFVRQEDNL